MCVLLFDLVQEEIFSDHGVAMRAIVCHVPVNVSKHGGNMGFLCTFNQA